MMYYQVNWCDYDDRYSGVIPGFFTTKEEAQKCADWHEKHPDPSFINVRCWVNEIDLDDVTDRFIPPMTDEEYNKSIEDYFHPQYDYPEDEE